MESMMEWAIPSYIPLATTDAAHGRKVWSIYLAQAKKYDKALVESWRDNVTGILIFAGLFSAVVAGFIVEGYKTLQPDPADSTNHLLAQISLQLAHMSNGINGSLVLSPVPQIPPSKSALACNILWFTSLGLSLSCALIATLVGQWTQEFLHLAERHSAPVVGARLMSYLYYGIRRYNMHTIVGIIPLLLHASLFLFFAGLVAFLVPINIAVMSASAAVFFIFTAAYLTLTILPLFAFDCPYRTPLSGILGRIISIGKGLYPRILFGKPIGTRAPTIIEATMHQATANTDERANRDRRALEWTVKSLVGDEELASFVDCIPALLRNSKSDDLNSYKAHIRALIDSHDVQLRVRIEGMLRSAIGESVSWDMGSHERGKLCLRALSVLADTYPEVPVLTDAALIQFAYDSKSDSIAALQLLSLTTISRNRAFIALDAEMAQVLGYLETGRAGLFKDRVRDLTPVMTCLEHMRASDFDYPKPELLDALQHSPVWSAEWTEDALNLIRSFRADVPYFMLFRYLRAATSSAPDLKQHEQNYLSFYFPSTLFSSAVEATLATTFIVITTSPMYYGDVSAVPSDFALQVLANHWLSPLRAPIMISDPLIIALGQSKATFVSFPSGLFFTMVSCLDRASLWTTLSSRLSKESPAEYSEVLLRLCYLTFHEFSGDHSERVATFTPQLYVPALTTVATLPHSWTSVALTALLKFIILVSSLSNVSESAEKSAYLTALKNPHWLPDGILPTETAVSIPEDTPTGNAETQSEMPGLAYSLQARCDEAFIQILADFIAGATEHPSIEPESVIHHFPVRLPSAGQVHPSCQLHLAESIHNLFRTSTSSVWTLQHYVKTLPVLQEENRAWLDDPGALKMIVDAFSPEAPYVGGGGMFGSS
ncbi:hypothetical protein C8R46DRAFT_1225946 [Mycena filopes]|nr:hypothetical protein C8R46DRAFT_1225946 [Mycena filopes]